MGRGADAGLVGGGDSSGHGPSETFHAHFELDVKDWYRQDVWQEIYFMDMLEQYLERAGQIIGDRTPGEARYDREVVRWLEKGKSIDKALAKANDKFPAEALNVDESMLPDLQSRYEYLAEHERIMRRLRQ